MELEPEASIFEKKSSPSMAYVGKVKWRIAQRDPALGCADGLLEHFAENVWLKGHDTRHRSLRVAIALSVTRA